MADVKYQILCELEKIDRIIADAVKTARPDLVRTCSRYRDIIEAIDPGDIRSIKEAQNALKQTPNETWVDGTMKESVGALISDCIKEYYRSANDREVSDLKILLELSEVMDFEDGKAADSLYSFMLETREIHFSSWIGRGFLEQIRMKTKRGRAERRRKQLLKYAACVAIAMTAVLLVPLALEFYQTQRSRMERSVIADIKESSAEEPKGGTASAGDAATPGDTKEERKVLSQYANLVSQNEAMIGWLNASGLDIDVPVMQERKEGFYLNHSFSGEVDASGALFVDKDTPIDPLTNYMVIFGHNMKSGDMFGNLDRYKDYDYWDEHRFFSFDTIYEQGRYEIVAVVQTHVLKEDEEGFRYYRLHGYETEEEFADIIGFIDENRLFGEDGSLSYGDSLVLLSTCDYDEEQGRLLVVGKRIATRSEEKYEMTEEEASDF